MLPRPGQNWLQVLKLSSLVEYIRELNIGMSRDSVIHQAVAVWIGEHPKHLLKEVQEEEYKGKLKIHRKSFMLYL